MSIQEHESTRVTKYILCCEEFDPAGDYSERCKICPNKTKKMEDKKRLTPLNFQELRKANLARIPEFKNKNGDKAHSDKYGRDWSLGDWVTAVTGELGEAANIIKKVRRGDVSMDSARKDIAKELADVQIYLDILAFQCGINLGNATIDKFNEVSVRIGVDIKL